MSSSNENPTTDSQSSQPPGKMDFPAPPDTGGIQKTPGTDLKEIPGSTSNQVNVNDSPPPLDSDPKDLGLTTPFIPDQFPEKASNFKPSDSTFIQGLLTPHSQTKIRVGRFLIEKELGQGAYGKVYLAFDEKLARRVAIKIPHQKYLDLPDFRENYLKEAKILAQMKHPSIVEVLEIGEKPFFLVSNFIEGTVLATRMKQGRMAYPEIAKLVRAIAQGLQHAHSRGLVHRDIKPANILIDANGVPCIVDFGMAMENDDFGKGFKRTGTPLYNSPEQARGEGHRVNGRSDIFSLGIIFFELLTGFHPFRHGKASREELLQTIITKDPISPHPFDQEIPVKLSGICLKCLAKDPKDRYQSCQELAEDLEGYLAEIDPSFERFRTGQAPTPGEENSSNQNFLNSKIDPEEIRVTPRGLRSFDEGDASFFLGLLPGLKGTDGLPESVRFWKTRIEKTTDSFPVGLIYGPSGSGKSSFVRAGILPHLNKAMVVSAHLEAVPGQTEFRLLAALRKFSPNLPSEITLKEAAYAIRKGRAGVPTGRKLLIVLDQFEQWLHERQGDFETDLLDALRQFDGVHSQCILLVRDDFWLTTCRFMKSVQIDLVPDQNIQLVDLFELEHAKKVLRALGRAYGRLPEFPNEPGPIQKEFIKLAINGLAQENRVISVRLALFAQMMKNRSWTPGSLKEVGGIGGLGTSFLEDTFISQAASPGYRIHQRAVQGVLKSLLPDGGSDIKGRMRTRQQLQTDAGYEKRPQDFETLLRILDREIRLITPTEIDGEEISSQSDGSYYQLTHDYLVPSIRDWVQAKQKETRRGRAEILLAERAALWKEKKQTKQLPSLQEYLKIAILTRPFLRTPTQKELMRNAFSFHSWRVLATVICLSLVSFGIYETYNRLRTDSLINQLTKAEPALIPGLVKDYAPYSAWGDTRLEEIRQNSPDSPEGFAASIALLPRKPDLALHLADQLATVTNERFVVLAEALRVYQNSLNATLWSKAHIEKDKEKKFRMAAALAIMDPQSQDWDRFVDFISDHLTKQDATNFLFWRTQLEPIGDRLVPSLVKKFRDGSSPEQVRSFAGEGVIAYAKSQPFEIYSLLADSEPNFYSILQKACFQQAEACVTLAKDEIRKAIPEKISEAEKEKQERRKANSAVFLLNANQGDQFLWDLWKFSPDPGLRSELIHDCPILDLDPAVLIKRFREEKEISTKRALVLALGSYPEGKIAENEKASLLDLFLKDFTSHPDAGFHGALEWTLRKWGQENKVEFIIKELSGQYPKNEKDEKEWLISPMGLTMMVIPKGSFTLVSDEQNAQTDLRVKKHLIERPFLMASHEVTRKMFGQFEKELQREILLHHVGFKLYYRTVRDPQSGVTWYDAAWFCNWLSEKEGIPKEQWCYEPVKLTGSKKNETGGYQEGMIIKANHRDLTGYRLPMESEWEHACGASTNTTRYYGDSEKLLKNYATYTENSNRHLSPVQSLKPNEWGLFDTLGNAFEWCQNDFYYELKMLSEKEPEKITSLDCHRVLRGGSMAHHLDSVHRYVRDNFPPDTQANVGGFRPCRTYDLKKLTLYNTIK